MNDGINKAKETRQEEFISNGLEEREIIDQDDLLGDENPESQDSDKDLTAEERILLSRQRKKQKHRLKGDNEEYDSNLFPSYFYSGFWTRFFAFFMDLLVVWALTSIFHKLLGLVFPRLILGERLLSLMDLLILVLYFTLMTWGTKGQTLGKMVFGIRVVPFKEENLSFSTVFVRETLGRIIHLAAPLSFLYVITGFTAKKQNISDILADTSVVTENYIRASYEAIDDFNLKNLQGEI